MSGVYAGGYGTRLLRFVLAAEKRPELNAKRMAGAESFDSRMAGFQPARFGAGTIGSM
jgi:hypothetical protein